MYRKPVPSALSVALASVLLAACGGGGSDDDPAPVASDSSISFDPVQGPSVDALVDPDDASDSVLAQGPADDVVPTREADGDVRFGRIDALLGQFLMAYQFSESPDTTFFIQVGFGADNVVGDDPDDPALFAALASFGMQSEAGGPIVGGTPQSLYCGHLESDDDFLCIADVEREARTLFKFDSPVNGEAVGEFEFCAADVDTSDCTTGLLLAPDGPVAVFVTPASELATRDARRADGTDLTPYLEYLDQGTPAGLGVPDADAREAVEAIVDVVSRR